MIHKGLTEKEAEENIKKYGKNSIPEKKKDGLFLICLKQFKSPLIYVLLFVSVITYFMGDYSDSVVILAVVFINSIIGTFQSIRTNNVVASLKKLSKSKIKVIRENNLKEINIDLVTIGDIVYLTSGDIVPADGMLLESNHLMIDESKINGESMPVVKDENNNNVFRSTVVISGSGFCRIEKIGAETMIGQLSKEILENVGNETQLEKKIRKLTHIILFSILIIMLVIFIVGILQGFELLEMFKTAVSLAVSAIPEGLPIVITVVLSIGAWRISKVKALLKNLSSGATLATVSYICTDKTGTLTEGNIQVKEILNLSTFSTDTLHQYLAHSLDIKNISGEKVGDILELKIDDSIKIIPSWQEMKELPFVSENKYNAKEFLVNGEYVQIYKGAPEVLLLDHSMIDTYTNEGYRVLALGMKRSEENVEFDISNITPLGLIIFEDKIRHNVKHSVQECMGTGVKIMMITGDNINTAKHVAREVGISTSDDDIFLESKDLAEYSDGKLKDTIGSIKVIARANPLDKLRIVRILQEEGEIVAMTGDGVNDGPAIALADIGISMGTGTEVAKEASDLILVNDDFSNIRDGIFEARTIIENIKKTLIFLISTSVGEIIIVGGSVFLGLPIALLPAQILWLNLITDGFLDISIAQERAEDNYKKQNYKRYQGFILSYYDMKRIVIMALTMGAISLFAFTYLIHVLLIEAARTCMLVLMSLFQWLNALNVRKHYSSIFSYNIFSNKFVTGALIFEAGILFASVYSKAGNAFLKTVAIPYDFAFVLFLITISIIFTDEMYKAANRKKK